MKILSVLIAAIALFTVNQAQAQILNFAISGDNGAGGDFDYSGQGAITDTGNNFWNQINLGTYTTTDGNGNEFVGGGVTGGGAPQQKGGAYFNAYSDGVTTNNITLTTTNNISIYGSGNGIGQGTNGTAQAFFTPFEKETSGPVTFTLNNVSAGTYNLFLYGESSNWGGQATTFTAQTDITGASSLTANYSTPNISSFVQGVNYVEFQNLAVGVGGTITFNFTAASGFSEGDFGGLQLQTVAVPEPSTYVLMLAGLIACFAFWKRGDKYNQA